MPIINMHQAKTGLSDLVARAEAGEEIVIARRNKPAVKLVPVSAPDKKPPTEDVAAYYRNRPGEWDDMRQRGGFAEDKQAEFDLKGLREAVEAGKEYTIMQDGKPVAKVAPIEKKRRVPGALRGLMSLPDSFFDPLPDDELDAWEGKRVSPRDK
ncbi:type II toxin-antitoxin system Phd/YefM family antitoxin [Aminobacter sp. BE322]|uniref:type II toxin-antitoxin system Phd/YefM family antitoxin n=1 Tax=unclassified Aminobacter TaxID=2644704 RepID=UPI003D20404F